MDISWHHRYSRKKKRQWSFLLFRKSHDLRWDGKKEKIKETMGYKINNCPPRGQTSHYLTKLYPNIYTPAISIPQAIVKLRVESDRRRSWFQHLWSIFRIQSTNLQRHLRGGILKGGGPRRGKTRRSKRGDHGLVTRHLMRWCNPGSWKITGQRDS